jgi:uncharacterized membrane protein YbhN (UPF0104 family)
VRRAPAWHHRRVSSAADPERRDGAEVLERSRFELEFDEDFPAPALDRRRWVAHYLPQWTTPARSEARCELRPGLLRLRIDANQLAWRPEDGSKRRPDRAATDASHWGVGRTARRRPARPRGGGPKGQSAGVASPSHPALETPSLRISRRRALVLVAAGGALVASLVFVVPTFADLPHTWERLTHGDARWLVFAVGLEAVSFLGHIILFRAVGDDGRGRVGLRASAEITLAGHAATRVFASGGAGGVALTAWALRRSGMDRVDVAARMTTFLVLLYAVYMAALVVGGVALFAGVVPGSAPLALTLVPAAFAAVVIAIALTLPRLSDVLARAQQRGRNIGRIAPGARAIGGGVREAVLIVRRGDAGLLGALLWWAGDVAVLWACFKAFGESPAPAVVVMAYFIGMLANTLPLPGGIGGVDGGMVAALVAFGTDPALAVVAVLAYRGFACWLPIIPGAAAWVTLRRTVAGWQGAPAAVVHQPPPRRPLPAGADAVPLAV